METAAIIIMAGTTAIGAALGFGGGWVLRHRVAYPAYWFAIGGAVVGALASAAIVNGWGTGLFSASEQLAADQIIPYMREIRKGDPRLAERIETSIIRDEQDGKSAADVRTNAKAIVSSYVADKIPSLPNDLTYELYATTRDILAYLQAQGDATTCAGLALGRFHGDLDPKLSPELVERNNNTIVRVIAAKPLGEAPRMNAEDFGRLANDAFLQASQNTGVSGEQVDKLLAGEGDPGKTCRLMKGFIDYVLTQPVEVAAAALRTLAAGGGR